MDTSSRAAWASYLLKNTTHLIPLHLEQETQILHRQLAQRRVRVLVERSLRHGQLFVLQLHNLKRQLSAIDRSHDLCAAVTADYCESEGYLT